MIVLAKSLSESPDFAPEPERLQDSFRISSKSASLRQVLENSLVNVPDEKLGHQLLATNSHNWRLVSRSPAGDNDLAFGVETHDIATLRVQRAKE